MERGGGLRHPPQRIPSSAAHGPLGYLPAAPLAFLVVVLGFLPPPLLPGPLSPIV